LTAINSQPIINAMNALKSYMARMGVTQRELAASVGCTQGMVHQWVSGLRRIAADRVLIICRATDWNITPHELRPDVYSNPTDGLPADKRSGEAA